jgi:hypothetical protein
MKQIKLKIKCQSCNGTGIYVGMGERDGAGVVCYTCKGTGCQNYKFEYEDFENRVKRDDIKRVFLTGYGYCIGTKPITLSNGVFVDFSKEGVSYQEFLEDKMPKHIKQMGCPMRADQGACHEIKGFVDRCDKINSGYVNHIPSCKCSDKLYCWEIFENPKLLKEGI